MKNENDLRVRRTRRNIVESYLSLLEKKPMEKITVAEICKKAEISRNTFYQHFPYIEALDEAIVDSYIENIREAFKPVVYEKSESYETYASRYVRQIGEILLSRRDELRPVLIGARRENFFQKLIEEMRVMILESADALKQGTSVSETERLMAWYSAGSIAGYMMGCFAESENSPGKNEMKPSEELELLCRLHSPFFTLCIEYMDL